MRKLKAVPTKLWEPRVLIKDASGKTYSLKAIEDATDGCKDIAFPVDVSWQWLTPDGLPKGNWKDKLWWKRMGLVSNVDLRSLSMRLHARMHHCSQQVILLTQGIIKDTEQALATKSSLHEQTEECEMEMAFDALTDIDDLLVL